MMDYSTEITARIGNWLLRFFRWFFIEPKYVWFALLPFFVAFLFWLLFPIGLFNGSILKVSLETRFRLSGLFLELSGIVAVVCGITKNLKSFDDKTLLQFYLILFTQWAKRYPKFIEEPHVSECSISVALGNATLSGHAFSSIAPSSSIENRITFMEEQVKQLYLQIHQDKTYFENNYKKLSDALNAERSEREAGDNHFHHELKELATGDVHIELMGIIWLIFGTSFATASTELAKYFG
jgi:hypothetical protein